MKTKDLICIQNQNSSVTTEELECIHVTDFDDSAVSKFHTAFQKLESSPTVKVIPIIINSYGGSVYSLLAMLDILSSASKPIATIAIGKAMSCGSVLVASGTPGYRYAGVNSDIMIHEVSTFSFGKTTEIKEEAKNTDRLNNILMKKLAHFCGKKEQFFINKIKDRTNLDWYIDAKQAKKLGLVDHVGMPRFLKESK